MDCLSCSQFVCEYTNRLTYMCNNYLLHESKNHNNQQIPVDASLICLSFIRLCVVQIDQKMHCYLQFLENPTPPCWFTYKLVGHNKLEGTVPRLCKLAGIDEQLVMEKTGHRSLDGVRGYTNTLLYMPQIEAHFKLSDRSQ